MQLEVLRPLSRRDAGVAGVASARARVGVAHCCPPPPHVRRVPAAGAAQGGSSQPLAGARPGAPFGTIFASCPVSRGASTPLADFCRCGWAARAALMGRGGQPGCQWSGATQKALDNCAGGGRLTRVRWVLAGWHFRPLSCSILIMEIAFLDQNSCFIPCSRRN